MAEPQRIAKLLARAGVASRREIERMIADRRVAIDGVRIETPATIVTSLAGVTVDGKAVREPDHARLFLFHKPAGLLTTAVDPKGRPTIYDRLPAGLPRVVPVGRLDLATEGLLLLTTDGGLKRLLELPSTGVERTYRARTYGPVTQDQLESLSEGIEIEGVRYGSIDANMERRTGANQWIELRLREGKNREVRRVLEHLGLTVSRLIRIAYGLFVLADLKPGDVVEVLQHDLVAFRKGLSGERAERIGNVAARPATTPRVRSAATPAPPRAARPVVATGPKARPVKPARDTVRPAAEDRRRGGKTFIDDPKKTRRTGKPGATPRGAAGGKPAGDRPTPRGGRRGPGKPNG